jgi:hypothetical protein
MNMLIGQRQREHRPMKDFPDRPATVMGDFGHSEYSHIERSHDAHNPAAFLKKENRIGGLSSLGTHGYDPPVGRMHCD